MKPSELLLPYSDFVKFTTEHAGSLSAYDRAWLGAWNSTDLALSPMSDEHRRFMRYGHYLGWIAREK